MLRKLFRSSSQPVKKSQPIIIVSGLPRSGTSMMMKMLADGGLPYLTDEIRNADEDNPNGYYEFELVKQLTNGEPGWLADADGKTVKIISALLEYLPKQYHYKIIFMERRIAEILASQQKMLTRRNEKSGVEDATIQKEFEQHLAAVKYWLARQSNIDVLYIEYNSMVADPEPYCKQIAAFLNIALDTEKMRRVPSENLYRNRAKDAS
jgi:hypothetical protein